MIEYTTEICYAWGQLLIGLVIFFVGLIIGVNMGYLIGGRK